MILDIGHAFAGTFDKHQLPHTSKNSSQMPDELAARREKHRLANIAYRARQSQMQKWLIAIDDRERHRQAYHRNGAAQRKICRVKIAAYRAAQSPEDKVKRAQASAQQRKEKASANPWRASYDKAVKAAKRHIHDIVELHKANSKQTQARRGKYTEAYYDYLNHIRIADDASCQVIPQWALYGDIRFYVRAGSNKALQWELRPRCQAQHPEQYPKTLRYILLADPDTDNPAEKQARLHMLEEHLP